MPKNTICSAYSLIRARKAIVYINDHYKESLSPEFVAAEIQMDTKKLQALLRLLTGCTVHTYHMNVKIEQSKPDLADFTKALKEVADNHGFSSASHFIREFKKRTGVTPGQYRLQLAGPINSLECSAQN